MFQRQPNGQYEQLILGITDNGVPATLNLTESQQIGGEPHIFYYLTIGLVVFISVSFVGGLISCAFFRRRRAARSPVVEVSLCHDISHFDNFMPSCVAEGVVEDKSLCSICLGVIMPADYVRKMSCNHIFHSSCIDAWCIKSINCPICRADFSL